jgi:hypothetical protein
MKKSVEKKASKKPVVASVEVTPIVVAPVASKRKGNGFDIPSDRVITEIKTSKGNPYAEEAGRNGLASKAGDKFRAWEMAKVGMTLGQWRDACTKAGIALFADSGGIKRTVMFGDPPKAPEATVKPKKKR